MLWEVRQNLPLKNACVFKTSIINDNLNRFSETNSKKQTHILCSFYHWLGQGFESRWMSAELICYVETITVLFLISRLLL